MKRLFFIFLIPLSVWAGSSETKHKVPQSLIGTWQGYSHPEKTNLASTEQPDDMEGWVKITLTINEDRKITGTIGDQESFEGIYKKNRGFWGRIFKMKSDHILQDGYSTHISIAKSPEKGVRFTIPFNLTDEGTIKGGMMQVFKWEYPYPLYRIRLKRIES